MCWKTFRAAPFEVGLLRFPQLMRGPEVISQHDRETEIAALPPVARNDSEGIETQPLNGGKCSWRFRYGAVWRGAAYSAFSPGMKRSMTLKGMFMILFIGANSSDPTADGERTVTFGSRVSPETLTGTMMRFPPKT